MEKWLMAILECDENMLGFLNICKYNPFEILSMVKGRSSHVVFTNIVHCVFEKAKKDMISEFCKFVNNLKTQINNINDDTKFIKKAKERGFIDEEKYNTLFNENKEKAEALINIQSDIDKMNPIIDFHFDYDTYNDGKSVILKCYIVNKGYYEKYFKEILEKIEEESGIIFENKSDE